MKITCNDIPFEDITTKFRVFIRLINAGGGVLIILRGEIKYIREGKHGIFCPLVGRSWNSHDSIISSIEKASITVPCPDFPLPPVEL